MALDRKSIMVIAAVAGIGLLLYMRKSGDSSALGSAGGLLSGVSNAASWASQPIVINATTSKPAVVTDSSAAGATPAKAPAPPPPAATPWTMAPINGEVSWGGSGWLQANGKPVAEGYAFAHLTPEQRGGRTDGQIAAQFA